LLDCLFHTRNRAKLCVPLLQSKQYSNNFQVSAKPYAFRKKLLLVIRLVLRLLLSLPKHFHYWPMLSYFSGQIALNSLITISLAFNAKCKLKYEIGKNDMNNLQNTRHIST
jgi:hypothetical protein